MGNLVSLIFVYGFIFTILSLTLKIFLFLREISNHMVQTGYIKKDSFSTNNPDKDLPVSMLYRYYYHYTFVFAVWFLKSAIIFLVVLLIIQIISLVTTGHFFRNHMLLA